MISTVIVVVFFLFLLFLTGNDWGIPIACGVIVVLGSLAQLASLASTIVVDKDWIVILANGDQDQLASKIEMICYCEMFDTPTAVVMKE